MKIVIIGGAGFIGTHLAQRLQCDSTYDLLSYDLKPPVCPMPHVIGDVSDAEKLIENLRGADAVYLKAGLLGNPALSTDQQNFETYLQANIIGAYNVLEACRINRVSKLIFDSSVSVYGEAHQSRFAQESAFPLPRNLYGLSKINAERLVRLYTERYGINSIILRYSRVRNAHTKDVIYHFLKAIVEERETTIVGNPLKEIEFVHIDDAIEANVLALNKQIRFGQFNISTSVSVSLLRLFEMCQTVAHKHVPYRLVDADKEIEPTYTRMDISKAQEILGFKPTVTLRTMIEETLTILREQ